MTNYNERLDEVLEALWQYTANDRLDIGIRPDEAKQAITSLIKELVAEAKPEKKDQMTLFKSDDESRCRFYQYGGYNRAIDEFEQNLLKALEEV